MTYLVTDQRIAESADAVQRQACATMRDDVILHTTM